MSEVPVEARFENVPTASHQWMAAQLRAFPRISIDFLVVTVIHGASDSAGSLLAEESVNCYIGYAEEVSYTSGHQLCSPTLAPAYCDTA